MSLQEPERARGPIRQDSTVTLARERPALGVSNLVSKESSAEPRRELESGVSVNRNRARSFHRLAEAFGDANDSDSEEHALTEAHAFELYGNDNGEAFPGYFQRTRGMDIVLDALLLAPVLHGALCYQATR